MAAYWQVTQRSYSVTPGKIVSLYVVLDLDGDGDIDILHAPGEGTEATPVPLRVLINDGAGNLTDGTFAYFGAVVPEAANPNPIATVADFNGDGRLDVYFGNVGADVPPFPGGQNTLLLSGPDGRLTEATSTLPQVLDFTHASTAGDLDGDGDVDIVVMNIAGGSPPSGPETAPYVLLNNGSGQFTRSDDLLPAAVEAREYGEKFTACLLFDADSDGDLDLFLGTHGETVGEQSKILLNPGNGNFSSATEWLLPSSPWGQVPNQIALNAKAVDLNGDGLTDLVVTLTRNYENPYVQILINRGSGNFVDETPTRLPQRLDATGPTSTIVGFSLVDINGDGHLDILAQNFLRSPVAINDGTGHFVQLPASFLDYGGWRDIEWIRHFAADFNGDGRMDIYADTGNGQFLTFLQQDPGLQIDGTEAADGLLGDADAETFNVGAGNDVVFGGAGNDIINGQAGDDQLIGGAGADAMQGGAGNDIYVIDSLSDAVTELAEEGVDEVRTVLPAYTLAANVENLTGRSASGQALTGNALANVIAGGAGNDSLTGLGGNDRLDGGLGNDSMAGGLGDDVYVVDSAGDAVTELSGEGTDEIRTATGDRNPLAFALYYIPANVENLTGTSNAGQGVGGNALNNVVTAGSGADFIAMEQGGIDSVSGSAGNDVFYFGGALTAADLVDGGSDVDTLLLQGNYGAGGILGGVTGIEGITLLPGNLTTYGDTANNFYDYVLTLADANFAAGVQAVIDGRALRAGEDLTVNGSAETDAGFLVHAGQGVEFLVGGAGNDIFVFGHDGRFGSSDRANGGAGFDTMVLRGDYTLDFNAPGFIGTFANIEKLVLSSSSDVTYQSGGDGEFDYNVVWADALLAAGASIVIDGALLQLNETLVFDGSMETNGTFDIRGGAGNDSLRGGAGGDVIDGGLGNDAMTGGSGNDTYTVNSPGDVVTELSGQGTDTVRTGLGDKTAPAYALYYIPANVENLVATSNAGQGVGGNALSNTVTAGSGQDLIAMHQGGVDSVNAGAGADYIWFGDTLTGADVVNGGLGRDTLAILGPYASLSLGANVTNIERLELFSSGGAFTYNITLSDSVNSPHPNFFEVVALSLRSDEHLVFDGTSDTDSRYFLRGGAGNDVLSTGAGNDRIVGNDGNDQLFGNAGNDTLVGGLGRDTLDGGPGADRYEFAAATHSPGANYDTIVGFDFGQDVIDVPGAPPPGGYVSFEGNASASTFESDLLSGNNDSAITSAFGDGFAVLLSIDGGDLSGRHFLLVDSDNNGEYTPGADLVVELLNPVGLPPADGSGGAAPFLF